MVEGSAPTPKDGVSLAKDALLVAVVHAALCGLARVTGFDHVSDDDFARVTIAQLFVVAPKLDPSGTSWLPFPFWLLGSAMALLGRSLDAARALSIVFASIGAALPYVGLRWAGVARGPALLGTALAYATPWAIWLGAATVPESLTASLGAAAVVGLTLRREPRGAGAFACAIAAACLSRYETWPLAAVVALVLALRRTRTTFACAVVCVAAPLVWMAWNAHAHDGPLHFFRRVSADKRAIGEGSTNTWRALLLYPRLLVTARPEVTVPALLLLPAVLRDRERRARWAGLLLAVVAQIAFLSYGNARDGAPAHHPARALLGAFVMLALFVGVEGAAQLRDRRRILATACIVVLWLATAARDLPTMPGRAEGEERSAQIARGRELRGADRLVVTPCAYEHFALIAAYGAPERVETQTIPKSPICPGVEAR